MPKVQKDFKSIKRAWEYKKRGLGLVETAKLMDVHKKSVWRWWKYVERGEVAGFPQGGLDKVAGQKVE